MATFANEVFAQLAGIEDSGQGIGSDFEMESAIRAGLSSRVLKQIQSGWKLSVVELSANLSIPRSTLMQMMKVPRRMSGAESDRVYRLVEVLAMGEQYIGDRWKALAWFRAPNQVLGAETPLRAIETEIGRQRVMRTLGAIAYGGVS